MHGPSTRPRAVIAAILALVAVLGAVWYLTSDRHWPWMDARIPEALADAAPGNFCTAGTHDRADTTCLTPDPFQPPLDQANQLDRVFDTGELGFDFEMYGNDQKTIVVDGIPYAQYWQLDDPSQYVLHPMVVGRYIFNNADNPEVRATIPDLTAAIGTDLPNGGIAFYYPNRYPLSRMSGPEYMYSAISQSELLAGYMALDAVERTPESAERVAQVRDALLFAHVAGGVELAGVAQLELPLFHSNPEIILNGWLHSLLHLNDYADTYDDEEMVEYVRRNLEFFVENNETWYDESRNISLYSETSPHLVVMHPEVPIDEFAFRVIYASKTPELSNYEIIPVVDATGTYGGFDTRVTAWDASERTISANILCSGLFDTRIVGSSAFEMRVRNSAYDLNRSTPLAGDTWYTLPSSLDVDSGMHVAELALEDAELMCGFPTNFAKANGKNFYHMQHVVALLLLAEHGAFDDPELSASMITIAENWYHGIEEFEYADVSDFETPQTVLDGINRGKLVVAEANAGDLFGDAGVALLPEHE